MLQLKHQNFNIKIFIRSSFEKFFFVFTFYIKNTIQNLTLDKLISDKTFLLTFAHFQKPISSHHLAPQIFTETFSGNTQLATMTSGTSGEAVYMVPCT
jgi:hypothetical protein